MAGSVILAAKASGPKTTTARNKTQEMTMFRIYPDSWIGGTGPYIGGGSGNIYRPPV
jgi:hypothetical protein